MRFTAVDNAEELDLIPFEVARAAKFYGFYDEVEYAYHSAGGLMKMDMKRKVSMTLGMQNCQPAPSAKQFLEWLDRQGETIRRNIINFLQLELTPMQARCAGMAEYFYHNGKCYLPK